MAIMTDEEAEYWDEYYTKNTIMPEMNKPGFFARKYGMSVKLDPETPSTRADEAQTVHKTMEDIIGELVRENIAVGM
jgi:hypothetical protein